MHGSQHSSWPLLSKLQRMHDGLLKHREYFDANNRNDFLQEALQNDCMGCLLAYAGDQLSLALAIASPRAYLYSQLMGVSFSTPGISLSVGVEDECLVQIMKIPSTSLSDKELERVRWRVQKAGLPLDVSARSLEGDIHFSHSSLHNTQFLHLGDNVTRLRISGSVLSSLRALRCSSGTFFNDGVTASQFGNLRKLLLSNVTVWPLEWVVQLPALEELHLLGNVQTLEMGGLCSAPSLRYLRVCSPALNNLSGFDMC
ncbi:hypothetical protein ABL78_6999, partial [Leptomonas seymouri]